MLFVAGVWISLMAALQTAPATAPASAPTTAPSVVRSADGSIELTFQPGWEVVSDERHRDYQLFVSNPALRLSIAVRTYAKDDLVDMTLAKMDQSSREGMNWLEELQTADAREVKINGNDAIEHEMTGVSRNARWKYLCTTIETPKQFFCFYCVTTPTRFEKAAPAFQEIIHSARDLLDAGK